MPASCVKPNHEHPVNEGLRNLSFLLCSVQNMIYLSRKLIPCCYLAFGHWYKLLMPFYFSDNTICADFPVLCWGSGALYHTARKTFNITYSWVTGWASVQSVFGNGWVPGKALISKMVLSWIVVVTPIGGVMILLKTGVIVDIVLKDYWWKIPSVIIKHNENNLCWWWEISQIADIL